MRKASCEQEQIYQLNEEIQVNKSCFPGDVLSSIRPGLVLVTIQCCLLCELLSQVMVAVPQGFVSHINNVSHIPFDVICGRIWLRCLDQYFPQEIAH